MPRPLGSVWDHFLVVNEEVGKKHATCNFCSTQYQQGNSTRLRQHLAKCKRCPEEIKKEFIVELTQRDREQNTVRIRRPSSASLSTSNDKTKLSELRRSSFRSVSEAEGAHSPPPTSERSASPGETKPHFMEVPEERNHVPERKHKRRHLGYSEYQIFGDYVASEMRQLRFDHSRRKLKRLIQKAILHVGQEDDEL